MLELAFKNKYLIIVFALLVAVVSIVAIQRLPVDILPTYKSSAVQVLTFYPGMPAEVMEKDITSRLERWTGQSDGIERQESKSIIGVSIVKDYFRPEVDPNTAMSQVTSLAMSDLFYLPPGTIPPMVMPFDPTATIPLALLSVSSDSLSEKELYDIAYFQLRNLLGSVPGIIAPAVYGGKLRRIYMYVYPDKLQAYGLSQTDVADAVQRNNIMIPTGDINIGGLNYSVNANGMLPRVEDFNNIIVKMDKDGSPVYLKDIGFAKDSSPIQTNIVHVNGKRQVYIPVYKRPRANTIAAVEGVKDKLVELKERLPSSVNLNVIFDQSTYVRHSINGLMKEGLIGIVLLSIVLLLFLGNYRATFIVALSIPLSVMFVFIGLFFTGDSINSMTLGGMALAIGLLVDTSIVVLENIDKHLKRGKSPATAAYDGAKEVAMPVLVTAVTIIIVFFPIVFLTGIAKYLFPPLAIAVSLAMIGSLIFAMTLVPIAAAALFKPHAETGTQKGMLGNFQRKLEKLTERYNRLVDKALRYRWWTLGAAAALFVLSISLATQMGTELFPTMDVGQISIDARFESGTRIEMTEEKITAIEDFIKKEIGEEMNMLISNMGVLNDWPAAYTPNSGSQDAFINIQLKEGYKTPTAEYVRRLRSKLKEQFPGVQFIFNTGGLVTAALNFGLPSPIDVQIIGNDLYKAHEIAEAVRRLVKNVEGTEDVRIHQRVDHPEIRVEIDRTKTAEIGLTAEGVVKNTVAALNSTVNFKPSFWIDESNGNHYFVGVTYPEFELDDPQAVDDISITGANGQRPTMLKNIAKTSLSSAPIEINHLNIQRVTDVYANVAGRDIGAVANDIEKKLKDFRKELPEGYDLKIRGEVQSMRDSFGNLGLGLILAVIMVYLVIVPLLRSFKLPLIIVTVIPLGLIGVILMLLLTKTYLNIQSLMGVIMMVGISVSYSNLLVDKMNKLLKEGKSLQEAISEGTASRLRPILMTALVAVFALTPMALGYETGGEANVPLARAIIGGVLAAAVLALLVVPILFYLFNRKFENMKTTNLAPIIAVMAFMLSGCSSQEEVQSKATPAGNNVQTERNVPTVLVASPQKRSFEGKLEISGTARANQQVKLYAMVSGYVQSLKVDLGDFVKTEQVLAVLDNPEIIQQRQKAEAELKARQAVYERLKGIYQKTPDLTTIAELEKAEADYESANALRNGLQSQIGFLQVKAPFAGVITNRFVDRGATIQSGLNNSNAMPLFEIMDIGIIRVEVDVPETDVSLINKETVAEITFPELANAKHQAHVARSAYGLNPNSKTMKIEIDVRNQDFKIRPGMYAKITMKFSGHQDVLSVPNEAIVNVKGQSYVYKVADGVVQKVNIQLGIRNAQFTEILNADLKETDKIVIQGKEACADGSPVAAKEFSDQKTGGQNGK